MIGRCVRDYKGCRGRVWERAEGAEVEEEESEESQREKKGEGGEGEPIDGHCERGDASGAADQL